MAGSVILLNGASSAGKSTLCRALQKALDEPFLLFSPDLILFGEVLPRPFPTEGPFAWPNLRPHVFAGYFGCLRALAMAGNNVLTDFVLEGQDQFDALAGCLDGLNTLIVGVHCPVEELERRERQRGDRPVGDARRDAEIVHSFCRYDLEIESTEPPERNAERIAAAWQKGRRNRQSGAH